MKKRIRIICFLLVLALMLGSLAACKEEDEKKLLGSQVFGGEIVYIALAPSNILSQYPNSYIVYLKTSAMCTEELAEVLITEDTEKEDEFVEILRKRLVGNKIRFETYGFTDTIDPMHAKLYVAKFAILVDKLP